MKRKSVFDVLNEGKKILKCEEDITRARKFRKHCKNIKKYVEEYQLYNYIDGFDNSKFNELLSQISSLSVMNEVYSETCDPYVMCAYKTDHLNVIGVYKLSMWLSLKVEQARWYYHDKKGQYIGFGVQSVKWKIMSYKNVKVEYRNLLHLQRPVTKNACFEQIAQNLEKYMKTLPPLPPTEFKSSGRIKEIFDWLNKHKFDKTMYDRNGGGKWNTP